MISSISLSGFWIIRYPPDFSTFNLRLATMYLMRLRADWVTAIFTCNAYFFSEAAEASRAGFSAKQFTMEASETKSPISLRICIASRLFKDYARKFACMAVELKNFSVKVM